ncbi:hypothetical protein [Nocardia sp. NPDC004604]|uniref:hypothetical protein n=1 Tax=Nocardia sp. NPDC004604 TaxID=3157013 RepID=UPI0033AF0B56
MASYATHHQTEPPTAQLWKTQLLVSSYTSAINKDALVTSGVSGHLIATTVRSANVGA